MLRCCCALRNMPPTSYPKSHRFKPTSIPQPIIRRSRSWRGIMQIRFDDTKSDRNKIVRQMVLWSPLRVFGVTFLSLSIYYVVAGHDVFMLTWFGYESENTFEERLNRSPLLADTPQFMNEKAFESPVRALELKNTGERNFGHLMKEQAK